MQHHLLLSVRFKSILWKGFTRSFFKKTVSYDGVEELELGDLRIPISPSGLWKKLLESDGLQAGPKEWAGLVVFEERNREEHSNLL